MFSAMHKACCVALACALVLPGPAWAWGRKGHAAVAALAEDNLTPTALRQVRDLLENDLDRDEKPSGRKTLAAVASWPDEIRELDKDTYRGWHARKNLVCEEVLGACKDGHCVDQNLIAYAAALQDRANSPRTRNEALKWVMHLVGDLHQPLHSGTVQGGDNFRVKLEGDEKARKFHDAWDDALAKLALKQGPLEGRLTAHEPFAKDAPTQWMLETRAIARRNAFEPLPGFACDHPVNPNVMLDKTYQQQAIPVIRERMETAGLRLAQLLNQVLQ